jgi:hypothetical protein
MNCGVSRAATLERIVDATGPTTGQGSRGRDHDSLVLGVVSGPRRVAHSLQASRSLARCSHRRTSVGTVALAEARGRCTYPSRHLSDHETSRRSDIGPEVVQLRRMFWMKACPATITLAVRSRFSPRFLRRQCPWTFARFGSGTFNFAAMYSMSTGHLDVVCSLNPFSSPHSPTHAHRRSGS